jgi:hypothetical protein
MGKWRKLPVEIEAVQFLGDNWPEIARFIGLDEEKVELVIGEQGPYLQVVTTEGTMRADPTDWLIRGVKGEYYPCKDDIFRITYESAD